MSRKHVKDFFVNYTRADVNWTVWGAWIETQRAQIEQMSLENHLIKQGENAESASMHFGNRNQLGQERSHEIIIDQSKAAGKFLELQMGH